MARLRLRGVSSDEIASCRCIIDLYDVQTPTLTLPVVLLQHRVEVVVEQLDIGAFSRSSDLVMKCGWGLANNVAGIGIWSLLLL